MILEAIYNGDFYHSETVVPKAEVRKVPKRTENLREDYGSVGPEADKGGLRPGGNAFGSVLHRPVRGERVPLQGWILGRTVGAAGGGKADPNKEL